MTVADLYAILVAAVCVSAIIVWMMVGPDETNIDKSDGRD